MRRNRRSRKSRPLGQAIVIRLLAAAALIVIAVVAIAVVRAFRLPTAILDPSGERSQIERRVAEIDPSFIAGRLAEAVRFPTVSRPDGPESPEAFLALHAWLAGRYPAVHAVAEREIVADYSLLYRWPGRSDCRAAAFVSHLDVVPVEPGTEREWTHPPFAGVIADGAVWGRGAVDTKDNLVLIMEAAERLAAAGFEPVCDLYFIFGHDEEVGGRMGAASMAERLASRGVELAWVLDEAGGLGVNLDGSEWPPVAAIGVSSQGYLTLRLTARADGGHSASGIEDTAVTRLAEALLRLRNRPMPGGLAGVATHDVRARAAGGAFPLKLLAANLWLLRPLAEGQIDARGGRGMLRTTIAATVIEGGAQANVLPQRASALVNARIHPRDDIEAVVEHVRAAIDSEYVMVEVVEPADPPTRSVAPEDPAFRTVAQAVADVAGPVRIVPAFGFGGYDGRYFQPISKANLNFDFVPVETSPGVHGTDERLDVRYLAHGVVFYQLLMERHGQPSDEAAP